MISYKYFLFLLCINFLLSCITTSQEQIISKDKSTEFLEPRWVKSASHLKYQPKIYFLGVGSGDSAKEAQADAMGAVSNQIESKISSKTTASQAENNQELSSFFERQTTVSSQTKLQNVQFAEQYYTQEIDTYYVLAILKKSTFKKSLEASIKEQEKKLTRLFTSYRKYEKEEKKSLMLIHIIKYLKYFKDYEKDIIKLAITSGKNSKIAKNYNDYLIQLKLKLAKFSFRLEVKGKGVKPLATLVENRMISFGLRKAEENVDFILLVDGVVSTHKTVSLTYLSGSFKVSLEDSKNGKIFFQESIKAESGNIDFASASEALADSASSDIDMALANSFLDK